ncbi:hypothetical protein [Phaeobacter inhibens]|uniref:hypothetical protein n=1 Tax=Phaeobacter inhibens TaxID=221822 RepID=UPI0021A66271|nr:hypothetical protein [Phaeobacter inhibens]UWR87826.1 hypothetical protein K4L01_13805 [Phaeobacter inhibens]
MTWQGFKRFTIRCNLTVLLCGWLSFWGYGVWVGDIPPITVVPGLMLISAIISIGVTACIFVGCHSWLFLRAKQTGLLPKFGKRDYQALGIGIASTSILVLLSAAELSGNSVPDGIAVPLAILTSTVAILSLLYFGIGVGSQYFRWHFTA